MELLSSAPRLEFRSLGATLARLGVAKLGAMGAVALVALLGLWLLARAPQAPNALLYAGLEPADAGRIVAKLEELKVPVEARGDGSILVPPGQVARLRMQLAAEGLPRQNGAGYELLDQANPMQMTSFMQRVQRLRALEGELARTIVTMQGVRTARVHIVLPERENFSRDAPAPTASVTVTTAAGQRLAGTQANAIRLLVAGAVPRLRQEAVSVLDPTGVVLAADGSAGGATGRVGEMRATQEAAYQKAVLDLLEPIVGRGRVRAIAAVDIDATRMVARAETFDPMGQVERSRQAGTDQETSEDTRARDPVSVGQNLPNQQAQQGSGPGQRTTSRTDRNNSTVNYEISSRTEETTREPGAVRRLSVAVVVDGVPDANGAVQPRSREELERLTALVRSAVGFDERRGDRVTVEAIRFVAEEAAGTLASGEAGSPGFSPLWAAVVVLALVLGAGAWVALRRKGPGRSELELTLMPQGHLAAAGQQDAEMAETRSPTQTQIVINTINDVIDDHPDEAVVVIRAWLHQESPPA